MARKKKSIMDEIIESLDFVVKSAYDSIFSKKKPSKGKSVTEELDLGYHTHGKSSPASNRHIWFTALYLLLIFILLFYTQSSTGARGSIVFMSFLPVLLSIVLVIMSFGAKKGNGMLMALPIIIPAAYILIVGAEFIPDLADTEYINIGILNIALGILYSSFIIRMTQAKPTEEETGVDKEDIITMDLSDHLKNISDCARLINDAVSRVYSGHHGAAAQMRESIRIDPHWTSRMMELDHETQDMEIRQFLSRILHKLHRLYSTEEMLFGNAHKSLAGLTRNPEGKSRILTVLMHNGNENIMTYYNRALQNCNAALDMMSHRKS